MVSVCGRNVYCEVGTEVLYIIWKNFEACELSNRKFSFANLGVLDRKTLFSRVRKIERKTAISFFKSVRPSVHMEQLGSH